MEEASKEAALRILGSVWSVEEPPAPARQLHPWHLRLWELSEHIRVSRTEAGLAVYGRASFVRSANRSAPY
jgi:hypothetical protein